LVIERRELPQPPLNALFDQGLPAPAPDPDQAVYFPLFALGPAIFGQNNGQALAGTAALTDVLVVGGVDVGNPGQVAPYSNHGPSLLVDSLRGEVEERRTLDVVAAAGVQVSGFGLGHRTFTGTSASAATWRPSQPC
jgi:hypothetical protein